MSTEDHDKIISSLNAALDIAALRFDQIALDFGLGHERCLEISEYGSETRAAMHNTGSSVATPAPAAHTRGDD